MMRQYEKNLIDKATNIEFHNDYIITVEPIDSFLGKIDFESKIFLTKEVLKYLSNGKAK